MKNTAKMTKYVLQCFTKICARLKQKNRTINEYALFHSGFSAGYNKARKDLKM